MSKIINKAAGQVIFIQGQVSQNVYILQSGAVVLYRNHDDDYQKFSMVEVGGFFGIVSAVGGYPSEATAKADADSVIVELTLAEFKEMVLSKKNLFKNILLNMTKVARDQISALSKYKDQSKLNLNQRLFNNAKSFYDEGSYTSCFELCCRYIERFPSLVENTDIEKLKKVSGIKIENKVDESKTPLQQFIKDNGKIPHGQNGGRFNISAFKNFLQIYDKGEVICAEGEQEKKFYYLESGEVYLCKNIEGVNSYVSRCLPGDFFEMFPAIDGGDHGTTAIAGTLVKVLEFSPENFDLIFSTNVEMAYYLLHRVIESIHYGGKLNGIFNLTGTRERISAMISLLGESDGNGSKIDTSCINIGEAKRITTFARQIQLNYSVISALLHVTKNEIVERLKYLEENGILKFVHSDEIIVYDIRNLN